MIVDDDAESGGADYDEQIMNLKKYVIPEDEAYAANCIWMNGKVIVPDHFPKVAQIVRDAGYEVILVDTSEYRKIDGGLSCLSLRFTAQK